MAIKTGKIILFMCLTLMNGFSLNIQAESSSGEISQTATLDETSEIRPLDLTMADQSADAAYADYESLLSYINGFDNIDEIVTADILANFEPAVSVDRYTNENLPELFAGEEIWQYVYTTTDQMTAEESEVSITLFFNGNLLISAMLTSDNNAPVADLLETEEIEALIQSNSLEELEAAKPVALLQGVVRYNNQKLHHLVLPTEIEQYYLLYLDGELIDDQALALEDTQENIHRIMHSINQVAQNIGLLEEAS
ncbi:hypothetical protein HYO62_06700 [Aerococcaceae bacterium DSM 111022]|nr:hypothetical protein [Aerococcaceae bacterium DSM 111022]